MIEPSGLKLPDRPGFDASAVAGEGGPGLYVVIGENNSGKTRLLLALAEAQHLATVLPREVTQPSIFQNDQLRNEWQTLPELTLRWSRRLKPPPERGSMTEGSIPAEIGILETGDYPAYVRARGGFNSRFWSHLRGELWPHLRARPATIVYTNRFFRDRAVRTTVANLDDPTTWAIELATLEQSPERYGRETFARIRTAFELITEGLRFVSRSGNPLETWVQVVDGDIERPLDSCGDGLRDLIGILLFSEKFPATDLMLDEPGLRLHPAAQRRLLTYLEGQTHERAIWIATHDGVFAGAPSASKRFLTRRDRGTDRVEVIQLVNHEELRQARDLLGWLPGDAFLVDRFLLVEGRSDRLAFEAIVQQMAVSESSLLGVPVASLGGGGDVWAEDAHRLHQRLELVTKIAPYARRGVILDRGSRSEAQREARQRLFEEQGFRVVFLPVPELENLWCTVPLVHHIARRAAEDASARRGEAIAGPSEVDIQDAFQAYDPEENGSAFLDHVLGKHQLRPSKERVAGFAMERLRELAPDSEQKLRRVVSDALAVGSTEADAVPPPAT
jgi:hypothetical protein